MKENKHVRIVWFCAIFVLAGAAWICARAWGGLHGAAAEGNLDKMKFCLVLGQGINETEPGEEFGETALWIAVDHDQLKAVNYLLARGANVDLADSRARTPLMVASSAGNLKIVNILLAHGARPCLKDYYGDTALKRAEDQNHSEAAAVLRQQGCK